jgi:hypothetical protein
MRVVSEFVKNDLSEDQLLPVVQDLVPALLAVLGSPQVSAEPDGTSTLPGSIVSNHNFIALSPERWRKDCSPTRR